MVKTISLNNTKEIISKIDKLVLEFCDTSVNCDSLKSLHACMENILDDGYTVCIFTIKRDKHIKNKQIYSS